MVKENQNTLETEESKQKWPWITLADRLITEFGFKLLTVFKESYWYESPGDYWDKRIQWKSPTFLLSGDKHTYFFDWSNAAYYHNIMAAGYFIVPFDGVYTFHVSADDRAELRYDFDDKGKGWKDQYHGPSASSMLVSDSKS